MLLSSVWSPVLWIISCNYMVLSFWLVTVGTVPKKNCLLFLTPIFFETDKSYLLARCMLYRAIVIIEHSCFASFYYRLPETSSCLFLSRQPTLISYDFLTQFWKKLICLEPSWKPTQYFEMPCPESITADDALFMTTVFTSMNIHDGTTRKEWGWDWKTD